MFIEKDFHSLIVVLWTIITKLRSMARAPTTSKADFYSIFVLSTLIAVFSVVHVLQQVILVMVHTVVAAGNAMRHVAAAYAGADCLFCFFAYFRTKANERKHQPAFPYFPNFWPTPLSGGFATHLNPISLAHTPINYNRLESYMSPISRIPSNDLVSQLWDASYQISTRTSPNGDALPATPATPPMTFSSLSMSRSSSSTSDMWSYPATPNMASRNGSCLFTVEEAWIEMDKKK